MILVVQEKILKNGFMRMISFDMSQFALACGCVLPACHIIAFKVRFHSWRKKKKGPILYKVLLVFSLIFSTFSFSLFFLFFLHLFHSSVVNSFICQTEEDPQALDQHQSCSGVPAMVTAIWCSLVANI